MNFDRLKKLAKKRAIDLTAEELAEIVVSRIQEQDLNLEFVGKDLRNKLLYANSDSKAGDILRWGKLNGYLVEKRGGSYWKRVDLESLRDAYWGSK